MTTRSITLKRVGMDEDSCQTLCALIRKGTLKKQMKDTRNGNDNECGMDSSCTPENNERSRLELVVGLQTLEKPSCLQDLEAVLPLQIN